MELEPRCAGDALYMGEKADNLNITQGPAKAGAE